MPDKELRDNVSRMVSAGVPEHEIGNYIQQYGGGQQQPEKGFLGNLYDAATSRETAQVVGSLLGGIAASPSAAVSGPIGPLAGAGLGSAAGGQIHDLLTGQATGGIDQLNRAGIDVATDVALGAVMPKALQVGGQAIKRTLSPIKGGITKRAGTAIPGAVKDLEAVEKAGFKLDVGMIDNPELQQLSASMRNKPGSGSIMAQVDRANAENAVRLSSLIQQNLGEAITPGGVGSVARKAAGKNKAQFFDVADKLYSKVDKFVPGEVPANNVARVSQEIIGDIEASQVSMASRQGELGIAYNALEDIGESGTLSAVQRRSIKQAAKNSYKKAPGDITDTDRSLMALERAIAKDVEEAAIAQGGDDALKAIQSANKWWKKGLGNKAIGRVGLVEDFAQIEKMSEPGKIYSWMLNEAGSGGSKLKRLVKAMPEIEGPLKATTFREMGRPTKGVRGAVGLEDGDQFSFSTFLTNANKLSPGARKILFKGAGPEYKNLLKASDFIKAMEKRANFSNTESTRVWNELTRPITDGLQRGVAGGLAGGYMGVGPAIIGATTGFGSVAAGVTKDARVAQLITDPDFIKWLANTGKKVAFKPSDISSQVAKLSTIATGKPAEMREEIIDYMNGLGLTINQRKDKDGNVKLIEVQ
jgi:hypothetical protein